MGRWRLLAAWLLASTAGGQTLTASPDQGEPGDLIDVQATAVPVGTTFTLELDIGAADPVVLQGPLSSGRTGDIVTEFNVPRVADGEHTLRIVRDATGGLTASTAFTVGSPGSPATLTLRPNEGAPGDPVQFEATGLTAGVAHALRLRATPRSPAFDLGAFTADRDGIVAGGFAVPDAAEGRYVASLELIRSGAVQVEAPFVVLPADDDGGDGGDGGDESDDPTPLGISVSPGEAFAGDTVTVEITALVPGTTVAFVEGLMVAGPVGVEGPSAALGFRLPEGIPGPVDIAVENRVAGVAVGTGTGTITRREKTRTAVRFSEVEVTRRGGALEGIDLAGRFELPDGADIADFTQSAQFVVCREDFVSPVPYRSARLAPDGTFAVTGILYEHPSFGTFSLPVAGPTDQYGFVYTDPDTGETACYPFEQLEQDLLDNLDYDPPRLLLRIADSAGNGIPGVRVSVSDALQALATGGPAAKGESPNPNPELLLTSAQVNPALANFLLDVALFSVLDAQINDTCPDSLIVYRTDADGIVRDQNGVEGIDVEQLARVSPSFVFRIDEFGNLIPPEPEEPDLRFSIKINALPQGFGFTNAAGTGAPSRFDVGFGEAFLTVIGADGQGVPIPPEQVVEVRLPAYDGPQRFLVAPRIERLRPLTTQVELPNPLSDLALGLGPTRGGKGASQALPIGPVFEWRQGWGELFTYPQRVRAGKGVGSSKGAEYFVPDDPARFSVAAVGLVIKQPYDRVLLPSLANTRVRIRNSDGDVLVDAPMSPGGNICDAALENVRADIRTFVNRIGEVEPIYRMPAGTYAVDIRGETSSGPITSETALVVSAAPTWFRRSDVYDQSSLEIDWSVGRIAIDVDEPAQLQDASSNNPGLQRVGIGTMENDNMSDAWVEGTLLASGAESRKRYAATSTQFSGNEEMTSEERNLLAGSAGSGGKDPAPCPGLSIDPTCIELGSMDPRVLINTGKIPLFRYAWGIPPIAAATLGADFWFLLTLKFFGTFSLLEGPLLNLIVQPTVNAGVDVFFDLSILFGLASARVDASPNIAVAMPIEIEDNKPGADVCFNFDLDLGYRVALGFCALCLKAEDEITLFRIAEPGGCSATPKGGRGQVDPPLGKTAMATNGQGRKIAVWDSLAGIEGEVSAFPSPEPFTLASGPGAMRPAVAFLDADTAVVVWSQSSLSPSAFQSLVDSGAGVTGGQDDFHLVYAVYDQGSFGPTQPLTLPQESFGEGGVVLASCLDGEAGCPVGGEVMALWERDDAGDYELHDYSVHYAFFDGVAWTPPLPIDPSSGFKQVQPTATYLDGEPVAVWVENPGVSQRKDGRGVDLDLMQRFLRYRFVDTATAQDAAGLPTGVASPSIVASGGQLLASFTTGSTFAEGKGTALEEALAAVGKAPGGPGDDGDVDPDVGFDPDVLPLSPPESAFLGARRALYTAETTGCSDGVCTWTSAMQTDDQGRVLYAERPELVIDAQGTPSIVFRYLGNSDVQASDPIGVTRGTGDLARLPVNGVGVGAIVQVLTNDGRINWQNASVYDAVTNQLFTVGAIGPELDQNVLNPGGKSARRRVPDVLRKGLDEGRGIEMRIASLAPDLFIRDVTGFPDRLVPGDSFEVELVVANRGGAAAGQVAVAATFDQPVGLGREIDQLTLPVPAPGLTETRKVPIEVPPDFFADETRTVVFQVNPDGLVDEADGTNNRFDVRVGELPRPFDLVASSSDQGTFVQLRWNAAEDDRVTGYLVYRENPDASLILLGRTPVAAYADVRALPDVRYRYRVVSVSDRMVQSPPSAWVAARVPQLRLFDPFVIETLFADGFEARESGR